MKLLLVAMSLLLSQMVHAEEFRFQCVGEVTGLCDSVRDNAGKKTTIKITKDSDPESLAVFLALQRRQIYGTEGVEDHQGAKWEQGIILVGDFASETKRTKGGPTMAPPENYREFRMTGIKVLFPVSRFEVAAGGNVIDGPMIIETHFGFDSLFPQGVALNGKPFDLAKHVAKRSASQ